MFKRRRKTRRGVVLLVVLSLLVLFLMIAVTFVLIAGQYKRGAIAISKVNQTDDPPEKLLDAALYQLLRGTNMRSSLFGHDLLGDLYGIDGVGGTIGSNAADAAEDVNVNGQILVVNFSGTGFSSIAGSYVGNVFTMLEGTAKGHSTRVVGYAPTLDPMTGAVTGGSLRIEAFDTDSSQKIVPSDLTGRAFGINGRAFNGTGAGYDTMSMNLDAVDEFGNLVALLPHYITYTAGFSANRGGGDESWDAVDLQTLPLAMVPPSATSSSEIIPSFHRPELVKYWSSQGATASLYSRFVLRPLPIDHPNFTGSNPHPALTTPVNLAELAKALTNDPSDPPSAGLAAWDVDNDGDGITDSIWIDIGLPIKRSPDGKLYKPLVAILCRDLDGRLNVNAHGNLAQLDPTYTGQVTGSFAGGSSPLSNLPRGLGEGPADVYLGHIFSSSTEHTDILRYRYGPDGGTPNPGLPTTDDSLSMIKQLGVPNDYSMAYSSYGSPPDVWGRGALGLDYTGHPITPYMGVGWSQRIDDPYEIDLSKTGSQDTGAWDRPYTVAELERVLRWYDVDAPVQPGGILNGRLLQLAAGTFDGAGSAAHQRRAVVTTESRHIPIPNVMVPPELRDPPKLPGSRGGPSGTLLEMFAYKLTNRGSVSQANVTTELGKMLPFEILHGEMFDLNRPFGNGQDTNSNNVIDEPLEDDTVETIWTGAGLPATFASISLNHTNNDPSITVNRFAKQIYARHLYCLMMLLNDNAYVMPPPPIGGPPLPLQKQQELTAQRIAQWAINVVDFRDPDAIMTPFEYDWNPLNGWVPMDGNVATDEGNDGIDNDGDGNVDEADEKERRVVWGCEYPDVVLTESFACHNRRVKDTKDDDGDADFRRQNGTDDNKEEDDELDQYRVPQGSLFFELLCTRNRGTNNPILPQELYNSTGGIDLGRLAPAGAGGIRQPVWRVAIIDPNPKALQPPKPKKGKGKAWGLLKRPAPRPDTVERIVWFAPYDPAGNPDASIIYYGRTGTTNTTGGATQQGTSNVTLLPGGYAVVGPRTLTRIGLKDDVDSSPSTHDSSPHVLSLAGGNFSVMDNDGINRYPTVGTNIRQPLAIVAAAKPPTGWMAGDIGISVSEPFPSDYYPVQPSFVYDAAVGVPDGYDNRDPSLRTNLIPDTPFDEAAIIGPENLLRTGTYRDYKGAVLQRLANPLEPWNPMPDDPVYSARYDSSRAVNPYLEIDRSSIDLSVFNGEDKEPNGVDQPNGILILPAAWTNVKFPFDPDDPNPGAIEFASRERGNRRRTDSAPLAYPAIDPVDSRLWKQVTTGPVITAATGPGNNIFRHNLVHTLGYLNFTMGSPRNNPAAYIGDPQEPFPWLTWNNRPYANALELMLVPASSSHELLQEFSLASVTDPYNGTNQNVYGEPFTHLLNFFQSAPVATPPSPPNATAHYYRLFDYVETPSKFVGAERWYNPSQYFSAASGSAADSYRPPFNRWSRFRDPGKVNINTIFDPDIWEGITKGFPNWDPSIDATTWNNLVLSRQGYGMAPGMDPAYPTRFANPFRSAASADLMPLANMRKPGVEATLLRPQPSNANAPLFENVPTPQRAYDNTDRNPYFRYQGLMRLGNLLSTHSNVFAVSITVGYFEVEPNPGTDNTAGTADDFDATHPDGYRLAQELGLDSGEVQRHRAFYIIDRSIPVAYQPGENHNVDRTILLRRFIE